MASGPILRSLSRVGSSRSWGQRAQGATTRDSAIAYLSTVTLAPITSTIRGVPSEVVLNEEDGMKAPCAVNLHNAVTISQNRLGRRVAQLSSRRMREVARLCAFPSGAISIDLSRVPASERSSGSPDIRLLDPLSMTKPIVAPLPALAQITTPSIRNTRFRGTNFGIAFGSTSFARSRQNS